MRAGGAAIVRMAELEIDPARFEEYKTLLAEEIEASLWLETGVLALQAVSLKGLAGHVRIFEVYADRAAYEAHLLSPHFLRYKGATAEMVRSLRLLEADPIVIRAKACAGDGSSPN